MGESSQPIKENLILCLCQQLYITKIGNTLAKKAWDGNPPSSYNIQLRSENNTTQTKPIF